MVASSPQTNISPLVQTDNIDKINTSVCAEDAKFGEFPFNCKRKFKNRHISSSNFDVQLPHSESNGLENGWILPNIDNIAFLFVCCHDDGSQFISFRLHQPSSKKKMYKHFGQQYSNNRDLPEPIINVFTNFETIFRNHINCSYLQWKHPQKIVSKFEFCRYFSNRNKEFPTSDLFTQIINWDLDVLAQLKHIHPLQYVRLKRFKKEYLSDQLVRRQNTSK